MTILSNLQTALGMSRTSASHVDERIGGFAMSAIDSVPVFVRDRGQMFQPLTSSAQELMGGANGSRIRGILDVTASLADERPDSQLRGLVLTESSDALLGWWRLRELANDMAPVPGPAAAPLAIRMLANPTAAIDDAVAAATNVAHYEDGYIVDLQGEIHSLLTNRPDAYEIDFLKTLGQENAELARQIAADDDGTGLARLRANQVKTLVHEVEHADGIVDYRGGLPERAESSRIFEEGGDQVVTNWPGRLEAFVRRAGIADEVDSAALADPTTTSYNDERIVMTDFVRRSGIDTDDPAAIGDVVALLRGRRYYDVAIEGLAAAIGRHEGNTNVGPFELEQLMRTTPASDALRAELALDGIVVPAGARIS